MEAYLRRGKLGSAMDEIGLRGAILLAALGWFVWLWGLGLPALLAGLALGLMGQMALSSYRRRTVDRREKALRQRIGGELLMENLLLCGEKQAHFQAALLLGQRYPLVMEQAGEEGVLCRFGNERLLVACLRKAAEGDASPEDVLQLCRRVRRLGADRGVWCLTGRCPRATEAFSDSLDTPVRFISRETMLALAGQASPATDEQLIRLKKRKKRPGGSILRTILHRDRAKRYMVYGMAFLFLYVLTGNGWYPWPGLTMVCLGAWSRSASRREEPL